MHLLRELNLSADQTQRIQGRVQQYRAAHPKGSPKDRQAAKALRGQILAVLTPEQQARLKTLRKSARGTPKHHQ
ncbi:MAG: hypothetical protein DLM50_07900 [Candidatus Meridianibacter frigidus]|nr:MAG: hypothetical protein DLM50_07900 [Candidatus Eremiobacteraeota bacterium]